MAAYALVFLAGIAGSFHCVGMCGGFACAIGADPRGRGATLRRHLIYNTGRVATYCFLGALAGYIGSLLIVHYDSGSNPITISQRVLALASGALMLVIGLQFLGYIRRFQPDATGPGGQLFVPALRGVLNAPGSAAPLAFGVFNGLLPCPLVYAFAAQAAASGGPLSGLLVMVAFGLGTFPAMLLMGGIGMRLRFASRLRGVRIAGAFIIVFGLITLARGIAFPGEHSHVALLKVLAWCARLAPEVPGLW